MTFDYKKYNKKNTSSLLINTILNKKCSNEDKVARILAIDDERANEGICDYVVENHGSYDEAADEIIKILNLK